MILVSLIKKIFLLIFLFFAASQISHSAQFLPSAFQVKFEQSYQSVTGATKKSEGLLDYQFPGKIRIKEFKNNTIYISNGKKTWYYTPPIIETEKGSVQVSSTKPVMSKLFDTLQRGLKTNEVFQVKNLTPDQTQLEFNQSASKEFNLTKVSIHWKGATIRTLEKVRSLDLNYLDGKKVTLSFTEIKKEMKYSQKHFEFNIPKNTQIIQN